MKKVISILTATRAEYGLLRPIMSKLSRHEDFDVRIAVTGMHLSPEFGLTYQEIEKDNFHIDKKIEILVNSGTSIGVSKSMGLAMISFAEYFDDLKPDLLIVLGDRYETLAVCCAAMNARIPIAHIHGGESTEGLIDEAIRHSITKMSYLHFTSTDAYRNRVIQLGEHPDRVFNVGAIGLEVIKQTDFMSKSELENSLNFSLGEKFAILTYHPVTLEDNTSTEEFINILKALDHFMDMQVIITKANSDMGGSNINRLIDDYVANRRDKYIAFHSLGQRRYLSAMRLCSLVIGNSSSGIIETPTFYKPTINIGDRQKGRVQAESVINCGPVEAEVVAAILKALSVEFNMGIKEMQNPYGDGEVSDKIIYQISKFFQEDRILLKKQFYNL